MTKLRSPDELMAAAKEHMIDSREPSTHDDWSRVMNFIAFNIAQGMAEPVCLLMKRMYNIPLEDEYIKDIAAYQEVRKTDG